MTNWQGLILDGTKMIGSFSRIKWAKDNGFFIITNGKIFKYFINSSNETKRKVRIITAEVKRFEGCDETDNEGWTEINKIARNFGHCMLKLEPTSSDNRWIQFNIGRKILE